MLRKAEPLAATLGQPSSGTQQMPNQKETDSGDDAVDVDFDDLEAFAKKLQPRTVSRVSGGEYTVSAGKLAASLRRRQVRLL